VPLTGGGKIWLPPGVRAMASRVRRGGAGIICREIPSAWARRPGAGGSLAPV